MKLPAVASPPQPDSWLTLKDAAALLGVHPTTLRRWADEGQIPHITTPGGHRRFSTQDVTHLADTKRGLYQRGVEKVWGERAIAHARHEFPAHQHEKWLTAETPARDQLRQLGRHLMGVIMQYLSARDDDPAGAELLNQARQIGRQYGQLSLQQEHKLTDALQATQFFRDNLLEAALQLPEATHLHPSANARLMRRINTILNIVQLVIADVYSIQQEG